MIKEEGLQKVAVALASQEGKPRTFTWWEKQLRLHEPARISVVAGRALLGATVLSCGVFASGMLGLMYAMDIQSMDDFSYKTKTSFAKMRKKTLSVLGVKVRNKKKIQFPVYLVLMIDDVGMHITLDEWFWFGVDEGDYGGRSAARGRRVGVPGEDFH